MKNQWYRAVAVGMILIAGSKGTVVNANDVDINANAGVSKALADLIVDIAKYEIAGAEIKQKVANPYEPYSSREAYLLAKIAMAEAEGEDCISKQLVIETVLNRVDSDDFPNNVETVIYEKHQFTPIWDGRFDSVEPNDECWEALSNGLRTEDISHGALYFESCGNSDNWHSQNLQFLFKHGNLNFYR